MKTSKYVAFGLSGLLLLSACTPAQVQKTEQVLNTVYVEGQLFCSVEGVAVAVGTAQGAFKVNGKTAATVDGACKLINALAFPISPPAMPQSVPLVTIPTPQVFP